MLEGKNLSKELLQYVTEVANGLETANEREGYREIAIFKIIDTQPRKPSRELPVGASVIAEIP